MDLFNYFSKYRFPPSYPKYPPYHNGLYLEDYFYNYYYSNNIRTERILIPVSWTTLYIESKTQGLQESLDTLDPNLSYFTISQHDDAVKEKLPKNTKKFCAGGNNGGIPLPLVCSPIPQIDIQKYSSQSKDLLCSFYGSDTHHIRQQLFDELHNKQDCIIYLKKWSNTIDKENYKKYLSISLRSKFLLCPRGYGLNSFRLYESFQLGCVPVIITDKKFLPWENDIDWSSFSIIVESTKNLYSLLTKVSDHEYNRLLESGQKLYQEYFSINGICKKIIQKLHENI